MQYDKEHPYHLLCYMRCPKTELITRVDRYMINRFWLADGKRNKETLFYPSEFGMQEIQEYRYLIENNLEHTIAVSIEKAKQLVSLLDKLESGTDFKPAEPVKGAIARSAKKLKRSAKKLRR